MKYSDFKTTVQDIHTGATIPSSINFITKLVLGKIARVKLKNRVKIGEITVGNDTSWDLTDQFDGFLALKTDEENKGRCVYYMQNSYPQFLNMTNNSRYVSVVSGGGATKIGNTLKIKFPTGVSGVDTLYVPYYSKYLVLDEDDITEKEMPENDDDTFLLDSVFEDSLVEGVLLYLKRRELNDGEFQKAIVEFNKSLNALIFHQ